MEFIFEGNEATSDTEFAKLLVNEFLALDAGVRVQEGRVEFHVPFGWQ